MVSDFSYDLLTYPTDTNTMCFVRKTFTSAKFSVLQIFVVFVSVIIFMLIFKSQVLLFSGGHAAAFSFQRIQFNIEFVVISSII